MNINNLIAVDKFCANHGMDILFINSLQKNGMIEITRIEETNYFNEDQLLQLDRYIRFYFELNIHPEGIDSIRRMCHHVNTMSNKIKTISGTTYFNEYMKYMN